jgi:signal transduction histidine kinase
VSPNPYAQQYADLAELAGGFIHEIKNHLNTLSLNLQLLAEEFEAPESPRERRALDRTTRLCGECRRLADLSNDFLRFARVEELEKTPVALDDVIGRLVDFFGPTARDKNIEVIWYPTPDLPELTLDRELFEKALLNLVLNAEDAMPEGGTLTIQARPDDGAVVLEVIDTGCGIPADVLPRLFKPFVTTKPGGTGLGLATARKVVAAHGGTIAVESEPGRGTKVTVRLPVMPNEPEA